jgi:fatty acid desaturase/predicted heme/steroid binding protein
LMVVVTLTAEELHKHHTRGDMWVCIDSKIYDVSRFLHSHPGGAAVLRNTAGLDVSAVFHAFHTPRGSSKRALKILSQLKHVANLEDRPPTPLELEFRNLRAEIAMRGLYETDYTYYYKLGLWLLFLLVAAIYLVLRAADSVSTFFAGLVMALFLQQCAFVGHDAGHNAITHDMHTDMLIGSVVGPLLTGVSITWWKQTHNAHHVATNSISHDPDIQHMPFFAVAEGMFNRGGMFSEYHHKKFKFNRVAKSLISHQHHTFFPVMALARWNLYIQGVLLLLQKTRVRELLYVSLFWLWFAALTAVIPSWSCRCIFLFVSHVFAGILHVQIALSHFSMPTYSGVVYDAPAGEEFIRHQCATCMDIRSDCTSDWFHGGLQFQLAHHLFPRIPRHNLREVQCLVYSLCDTHAIPHSAVGWWEGIWILIKSLAKTASVAAVTPTVRSL